MGKFQLIHGLNNDLAGSKGLLLPKDFEPSHLSMLTEESGARSVVSVTGTIRGVPHHTIIRLQVDEGNIDRNADRIIAHQVVTGSIPLVSSPTDCVFLASCSYNFSLKGAIGKTAIFCMIYSICTSMSLLFPF